MTDEIKLGMQQARGTRAQELLDNELIKEAFKSLHDEYVENWKITHFKNTDGRERLWTAVQIVGKVQDHLKKLASDGRLASKDLAAIKTLKR